MPPEVATALIYVFGPGLVFLASTWYAGRKTHAAIAANTVAIAETKAVVADTAAKIDGRMTELLAVATAGAEERGKLGALKEDGIKNGTLDIAAHFASEAVTKEKMAEAAKSIKAAVPPPKKPPQKTPPRTPSRKR